MAVVSGQKRVTPLTQGKGKGERLGTRGYAGAKLRFAGVLRTEKEKNFV